MSSALNSANVTQYTKYVYYVYIKLNVFGLSLLQGGLTLAREVLDPLAPSNFAYDIGCIFTHTSCV